LSPSNILVTKDGESLTCKLLGPETAVPVGSRAGQLSADAAPYISPEAQQGGVLDGRSDLYAISSIFFKVIAGMHFGVSMPESLPEPLRNCFSKALAYEPDNRFQSATELKDAVTGALDILRSRHGHDQKKSKLLTPWRKMERAVESSQKSGGPLASSLAVMAAVVVVGLIAVIATYLFDFRGHEPPVSKAKITGKKGRDDSFDTSLLLLGESAKRAANQSGAVNHGGIQKAANLDATMAKKVLSPPRDSQSSSTQRNSIRAKPNAAPTGRAFEKPAQPDSSKHASLVARSSTTYVPASASIPAATTATTATTAITPVSNFGAEPRSFRHPSSAPDDVVAVAIPRTAPTADGNDLLPANRFNSAASIKDGEQQHTLESVTSLAFPKGSDDTAVKLRLASIDPGTLAEIDLNDCAVTGSTLKELGRFTNLRKINLTGAKISDDDLRYLATLHRLFKIVLNNTHLKGTGLAALSHCPLDVVNLGNNPDLVTVAPLPTGRLTFLRLGNFTLTDQLLQEILSCKRLKHLALQNCDLNQRQLQRLQSLPDLSSLNIGRTPLTDDSLGVLMSFKGLKEVNVDGTSITDAGRLQLKAAGIGMLILKKGW
jgi:uncharacterized protein YjbI with pentapeptide repeats